MAQTTSELWKTLLADPDAKREYAFEINGVWYGSEAEVEHSVEQSFYDAFGIGNATAATLSLTIFANEVPKGATIRRYIRLEKGETVSEWLPKGVFFANRRAEDNGVWTIEAFDAMRKSDFVWVPDQALEFPMKMTEAVSIFADIMGVEIDQRTDLNPDYTLDYPANDYTGRQILQFIAAANGGSFVISEDGKLRFIKSTGTEETHDIGMDIVGFTDNGLEDPVSRVTLLVDNENEITAGDDSGFEIVADCPYANQGMVDALLSALRGYRYQAYEAESANVDPAAEIGDQISVNGLMSVLARIVDNGYGYPDIAAPGEAEMEEEYPFVSPLTQAFNRKIADTYSAIEKTSERISWVVASGDSESNFTLTDRTMELLTGSFTITTQPVEKTETVVTDQIWYDYIVSGISEDLKVQSVAYYTGFAQEGKYLVSQNAGLNKSVAYCKVWFPRINEDRNVVIQCVNYAEAGFDFGVISNLDSELDGYLEESLTQTPYYYSFRGKSSPNPVNIPLTIPGDGGHHFITIKFVKDSSGHEFDDSFKFNVFKVETVTKVSDTKLSLNSNGVEISSATITFTGLVRFEDLSQAGATEINGANIRTDTLYVTKVKFNDQNYDIDIMRSELVGNGYCNIYVGDTTEVLPNTELIITAKRVVIATQYAPAAGGSLEDSIGIAISNQAIYPLYTAMACGESRYPFLAIFGGSYFIQNRSSALGNYTGYSSIWSNGTRLYWRNSNGTDTIIA